MEELYELQQEIIKKAMSDPAFRAELMANPKEALKKAFDVEFPEELNVKVVEEARNNFSIIIPEQTSELSDSDLDDVSGGWCGVKTGCIGKSVKCFCKTKFFG